MYHIVSGKQTPHHQRNRRRRSLYELLALEVLPQVQHLPGGESQQAQHGEDGEVEDSRVGRLIGVPHLLLALPHVREVLGSDSIGNVFVLAAKWLEIHP